MPAKSRAQYRAMQAAAHGRSTLGISARVGREYVKATGSLKGLPERKESATMRALKKRRKHG